MAWTQAGYKQIDGNSASLRYCLVTDAEVTVNASAGTATVKARSLLLSKLTGASFYNYTVGLGFKINNVTKYNGDWQYPTAAGQWEAQYKRTVNGTVYNTGCYYYEYSETINLTSSAQSIPIFNRFQSYSSTSYMVKIGNYEFTSYVTVPAAGAPSGSISVTSNTRTSATLTGSVSSWGTNSAAGTAVINYDTSTSYGSTATSGTAFSVQPNKKYYYKYTITNAAHLTATYTGNFTTPGNAPTVSSVSATPARTTATIAYSASYDTNASFSSLSIQYGTSTSYGSTSSSTSLTGLTPNTTYYYRICVTDNWNRTSAWSTGSFTTTGNAPVATALPVSNVTRTTATFVIEGTYDTNASWGGWNLEYGTTTSYGTSTTNNVLSGLTPNTTYYVRGRFYDNWGRWSNYVTNSFTTTGNVPTLTSSVSGITRTGATINYSASYDTNASYSSRSIQYGTTTSYGTSTTNNVLSGLTPNQLYYYRICVTDNWNRTSAWSTGSFTTSGNNPTLTNLEIHDLTTTSVAIGFTGSYDINASWGGCEIQYGTTTNYGTTINNNTSITGLTPNTLYYVKGRFKDNWNRWSNYVTSSFITHPNTVQVVNPQVTNVGRKGCTLSMSSSDANVTMGSAYAIYDNSKTTNITGDIYNTPALYEVDIINQLEPNTTYWARFALQTSRSSVWSSPQWVEFTTLPSKTDFCKLIYGDGTVSDYKKMYAIYIDTVKEQSQLSTGSHAEGITTSINSDGDLQIVAVSGNGNWLYDAVSNENIETYFEEGDIFTVSFDMKSSDTTDIPYIYIKDGMGYFPLIGNMSNNFSKMYYTGVWHKQYNVAIYLGLSPVVGTIIAKNFKIEKNVKKEIDLANINII